jgi:uncharacterized protein
MPSVSERQHRAEARHGLAFDRASVRTYDRDGRLHVQVTNISKAAVNPYIGREIPDYKALGVDPDRVYQLLRDPDELAKAADTFNNVPLLSRHVPVTADDHKPDLVIGSTGTDAEFDAPHLRNSLVIWARDAIDDVESEVKKQLSSAYRYRADMTPGTYEGQPYDGVMRDIVGNHVALVREGRAGSDVVVGDAAIPKLEELFVMSKKDLLSRKGAVALGALMIALRPKLAMDAQIDLAPLFKGVTSKNFREKRPAIVEGVTALTVGKLAQDASIGDVAALLDSLDGVEPAEAAAENDAIEGLPEVGKGPDEATMDAGAEGVRQFLTGKLSDEDIAKVCSMIGGGAADEDPEVDPNAPPALDEDKDKEMVDKPAMDAAIAKAVADTTAAVTAKVTQSQRHIREAERRVRPYVGELAIACDTAEAVYRAALTALGMGDKIKSVHASALPTILELQPLPDRRPRALPVAMDSAGAKSFSERFPDAGRIKLS